jgi:hypothetical protein
MDTKLIISIVVSVIFGILAITFFILWITKTTFPDDNPCPSPSQCVASSQVCKSPNTCVKPDDACEGIDNVCVDKSKVCEGNNMVCIDKDFCTTGECGTGKQCIDPTTCGCDPGKQCMDPNTGECGTGKQCMDPTTCGCDPGKQCYFPSQCSSNVDVSDLINNISPIVDLYNPGSNLNAGSYKNYCYLDGILPFATSYGGNFTQAQRSMDKGESSNKWAIYNYSTAYTLTYLGGLKKDASSYYIIDQKVTDTTFRTETQPPIIDQWNDENNGHNNWGFLSNQYIKLKVTQFGGIEWSTSFNLPRGDFVIFINDGNGSPAISIATTRTTEFTQK